MKKELRKKFLEKRNKLKEKEVKQMSLKIKERLYSMPEFMNAKSVLIYVSKGNEVYTHDIIEENLREKRISVPSTTKDKIIPSLINFFDELKVGMYGILEPKKVIEFPKDKIDFVILPGVAFDEKGNRIGYGKGYFDKFLKLVNCPSAALAFEMQITDKVPIEKRDIPVNFVVTEQRLINVKK